LKIGSSLLDSIVKSYDQNSKNEELQNAMNQTNSEISLYLSLLYMIIEVNNGDEEFSKDLGNYKNIKYIYKIKLYFIIYIIVASQIYKIKIK